MTKAERLEHARLSVKWMNQRATMTEMRRCMELDRKANREARAADDSERDLRTQMEMAEGY